MSNILFLNQPFVSVGLDDYTHTIAADGIYNVHGELTEVPPSGVSVLVKKNGSTIFTAPTLTPTQSAMQFNTGPKSFAAADVITVVIASTDAIDNQLNTVKNIVSIEQGF